MTTKPVVRRVFPTEAETARLINETRTNGLAVDLAFGPRGAWIEWTDGEEIPWTVYKLIEYRGLNRENADGDGI